MTPEPTAIATLQVGSLTLQGFSVSALATYVMVEGVDAVFDLGHCHDIALRKSNVFLSHVHIDHMGGVPAYIAQRSIKKMGPINVYCPSPSVEKLQRVVDAYDALEGRPRGVVIQPSQEVVIGKGAYKVVPVPAFHGLPSVGYTLYRCHQRNPEKAKPLMTFIGDSTPECMTPETAKSDVLVMECTFVDDDHRPNAAKHGHTHILDLVELFERSPEVFSPHIVLKHSSMRYSLDYYQRRILEACPPGLRERISFLVHGT